MRRRRRPPKRRCFECGGDVYAWSESAICGLCVRATTPAAGAETTREFRARVFGGRRPSDPDPPNEAA